MIKTIKNKLYSLNNYLSYTSIVFSIWYYSEDISNIVIKYKYSSIILVETIYWIFTLFCYLLDFYEIKKWKVTTNKYKTISTNDMFFVVIRNHIILMIFSYIYLTIYPPKKENMSNNVIILFSRGVIYYLLYDIIFYIGHRIMHHAYFYKKIHKKHHLTYADNGISGSYMGIIDFFGEFIIPFYLPLYIIGNDPIIMILYSIIGNINSVLSHSGFNFPFMPYNKSHLIHHTQQKYNYGIFIMDYIFGTNK